MDTISLDYIVKLNFSNYMYKQDSNFNSRIDSFDAKFSRYLNSHKVPKQSPYPNSHRFFGLTKIWLFGDSTVRKIEF